MSIESQIEKLFTLFQECSGPTDLYEKIIELGRKAPPLAAEERLEERLVSGCQSRLYLVATPDGERIFFRAEADALIANGLAQLLLWVYSGQKAEEIVRHDAAFLKELAIPTSLSPGRANGLANLLLRIKQEALRYAVSL